MGTKVIALILVILCFFSPVLYYALFVYPTIVEGDHAYHASQEEEALAGRFEKLNRALSYYLEAERKAPLIFRDWRGASRTGDVLFALNEYPAASYYYWQAYYDHPSVETKERLQRSLRKLNQTETIQERKNLPVSYTILAAWAALLALLVSILFSSRRFALITGSFFTLSMAYLLVLFYFVPLEGVVLSRAELAPDLGLRSELELEPGSKVALLDQKDGWIKVRNAEGALGYVPASSVRALH